MNNEIRQSNLELSTKLTERYVDRAHQLRREYIQRSVAGVGRGVRRSLARIGGAFRPIGSKEAATSQRLKR